MKLIQQSFGFIASLAFDMILLKNEIIVLMLNAFPDLGRLLDTLMGKILTANVQVMYTYSLKQLSFW